MPTLAELFPPITASFLTPEARSKVFVDLTDIRFKAQVLLRTTPSEFLIANDLYTLAFAKLIISIELPISSTASSSIYEYLFFRTESYLWRLSMAPPQLSASTPDQTAFHNAIFEYFDSWLTLIYAAANPTEVEQHYANAILSLITNQEDCLNLLMHTEPIASPAFYDNNQRELNAFVEHCQTVTKSNDLHSLQQQARTYELCYHVASYLRAGNLPKRWSKVKSSDQRYLLPNTCLEVELSCSTIIPIGHTRTASNIFLLYYYFLLICEYRLDKRAINVCSSDILAFTDETRLPQGRIDTRSSPENEVALLTAFMQINNPKIHKENFQAFLSAMLKPRRASKFFRKQIYHPAPDWHIIDTAIQLIDTIERLASLPPSINNINAIMPPCLSLYELVIQQARRQAAIANDLNPDLTTIDLKPSGENPLATPSKEFCIQVINSISSQMIEPFRSYSVIIIQELFCIVRNHLIDVVQESGHIPALLRSEQLPPILEGLAMNTRRYFSELTHTQIALKIFEAMHHESRHTQPAEKKLIAEMPFGNIVSLIHRFFPKLLEDYFSFDTLKKATHEELKKELDNALKINDADISNQFALLKQIKCYNKGKAFFGFSLGLYQYHQAIEQFYVRCGELAKIPPNVLQQFRKVLSILYEPYEDLDNSYLSNNPILIKNINFFVNYLLNKYIESSIQLAIDFLKDIVRSSEPCPTKTAIEQICKEMECYSVSEKAENYSDWNLNYILLLKVSKSSDIKRNPAYKQIWARLLEITHLTDKDVARVAQYKLGIERYGNES